MARIADNWLDNAIYLYDSESDARDGEKSGGSGFLVGIRSKTSEVHWHVYAVTNDHVIMGGSTYVRLNRHDGQTDIFSSEKNNWTPHPDGDDVTICKIGLDLTRHKALWIPDDGLLTKEELTKLEGKKISVGVGDEVFVVGRFVTHDGKQRNMPTVRFGHISMMPTPIWQHKRAFWQESYLVEAHSIGGCSGSPVCVYILGIQPRPERTVLSSGSLTRLLGVDWGHMGDYEPVGTVANGIFKATKTRKVESNHGMMPVVPAWKLYDLLYTENMQKERDETDKKIAEQVKKTIAEGGAVEDAILP